MRHQTPRENRIDDNTFDLSGLRPGNYGVWLGSRQGRRTYCEADAGYNFGSSADNRDFADENVVTGNAFDPPSPHAIRDNGERNMTEMPRAERPPQLPLIFSLTGRCRFCSLIRIAGGCVGLWQG